MGKSKPPIPTLKNYFFGFVVGILFNITSIVAIAFIFMEKVLYLFSNKFAPENRTLMRLQITHIIIPILRWLGIDLQIRGKENYQRGAVLLSKHMSSCETILVPFFPSIVVIVKKSLMKIPFLGLFLRHIGVMPVDRSSIFSSAKLIDMIAESTKRKRTILIYPEGTRVPYGIKKKYHLSIVNLHPNVPLIPVATNTGLCFGRGCFSPKFKGPIIIKILPAIPNNISKDEARRLLEETIEKESELLAQEFFA